MQPFVEKTIENDSWPVTEPEIMDSDKYLSSANAPDLEEDVRLCIDSGARNMIINCAPMTYATGAGMRAFVNIARLMQSVGGTLSVQNLHGQPHEIFMACGLDTMIAVDDTVVAPVSLVA